jgi:hypothetical protein
MGSEVKELKFLKESVDEILQYPQRKLVVTDNHIDLTNNKKNEIFILLVEESKGSAGSRAGSSGSRRISKVIGFTCSEGVCSKSFETEDKDSIEQFEIPISAVAMDIRLTTGQSVVVQGVVDKDLIKSYCELVGTIN